MRLVDQLRALSRALFRSHRADDELAEEMRAHIEHETDSNIRRGMSPDAARRAARLAFGSMDAAGDATRDQRTGTGLRRLVKDMRLGMRLLRKSPAFGITAVTIVALGIGASTAVFSVVHGVMLEPLPFREPERLVNIWLERRTARNAPSAADAMDLRGLRRVFEDVAFFENANLNLVGESEPLRLEGASVSPNLFSVLGVEPALGRTFARDEDQAGKERVIVLSDALWRSQFGADRAIVGRLVRLDGSPYTVVGVMPPEFRYPTATHQAWVPLVLEPGELTRETTDNYSVVARLTPQATIAAARGEAAALASRWPAAPDNAVGVTVDPMLDDLVRDIRPVLLLLLGAVLLLLLISCVNLSNLFAARARARQGEFAVRLALGASRSRLIAQTIAESAPVLAIGGALGVLLAGWSVRAFAASAPAGLPRVDNLTVSVPVVVASLALLVLTGLAASLAPAMQAWRADFASITRDGGRSATAGRKRSTARRAGVALQTALALPLLVGASLLLKSAMHVMRVDLGFEAQGVSTFKLEVSRTTHPSDNAVAEYYSRLVDAVQAVPGVRSASMVNRIPLSGGQTNTVQFETANGVVTPATSVDTRTITPDYFATLGIRLIAGRPFTARDDANAPAVAIVDERIAAAMWPGESAVGKRMREPVWRGGGSIEVVGVVAHVRTVGLETDPAAQVYWSHRQWPQDRMVLAVRSATDAPVSVTPVLRAIRSVDAEQSVYDVRTMEEIVGRSLTNRRLTTTLMAGFSAIALLLSAVGIYGVVAYGVTQRLREFGIRAALGATRRDVTRLVVGQGTSMALAGAAIGLVLTFGATGAMSGLVYGVAPRDVVSIVGATALLIVVAAFASWVPARQAAAVDPSVTLRAE